MELALTFLANRWGQLIAVALAAYFYGWFSVDRPDIDTIRREASEARDLYWHGQLAQKERENDARIAAALAAAETEPSVSDDRAERLRQCAKSPSCRDRGH